MKSQQTLETTTEEQGQVSTPGPDPKLVEDFLNYIKFEKKLGKFSIEDYTRNLQQFTQIITSIFDPNGRMDIDNLITKIDSYRLKTYLVELYRQSCSKGTITRKFYSIRSFYSFLLERGHIKKNPADFILGRKEQDQLPSLLEKFSNLKDEVVQMWLSYIVRFTSRTQSHYEMVIMRFAGFMPFELRDLSVAHIDRYINSVLQKWSNRTANAHLTAIKSFCRWLSEHHDLPNAARNIKMLREDPPTVRVLTYLEYQKVLAVCRKKEGEVIRFIGNTGLRVTEMRNLRWSNIALDLKWINFTGKGRKARVIPLNKTCQKILLKYERVSDFPVQFIEDYSKPGALYRLTKKLGNLASITRFGPHSVRHLFATRLMQKGLPLAKISRLLGHSSVRTTERVYIHWLPADLKGTTEILDL